MNQGMILSILNVNGKFMFCREETKECLFFLEKRSKKAKKKFLLLSSIQWTPSLEMHNTMMYWKQMMMMMFVVSLAR